MPGARRLWDYGSSTPRGAKFWLSITNELEARGVADVLIAVAEGLKGFPEATGTCIVHLIRRSLAYASYQGRWGLAAALKTVYRAPTRAAGEEGLDAFEAGLWEEEWRAPPLYRDQVRPELAIRFGERFVVEVS